MHIASVFKRALSIPMTVWKKIRTNPRTSVGALALVVVAFVIATSGGKTAEAPVDEGVPMQVVTLTSVGTLRGTYEPLSLMGEVRSVRQAELRAQKSGEVTAVYVKPGAYVSAGTVLADIDSAAERAQLLSAQGALRGAEAQLAKVLAGDRTEDKFSISAQAESAAITLASARESARAAYSQAYALAADAIYAQADDYFTNVKTIRPSFRVSSANYDEKRELETERVALGDVLETWNTKTQSGLADNELDGALGEAQQILDRVALFINTISTFISEQTTSDDYLTTSDKAAQEAQMAGARASVAGARSAVSGARQGLAQAQSAAITTSFAESKTVTGARPEDVAAAKAGVLQAQGAVASAQAALERALIRTPINGTVSTLSVSQGDFASAFQSVAVVVNPGALELEAFVTSDALTRIEVGMPVSISGGYSGIVTSRATGLDPETKKARVTISVPEDAPLVNGSYVELTIDGGSYDVAETQTSGETMVPITAIKVLPRGFALFTVTDGKLMSVPIEEGPIVGSMMLVRTPLDAGLTIVTDVRGLTEGDSVTIDE